EIKDGNTIVTISDNGIGIDPKYHEQVFDFFTRLRPRDSDKETGMGLAICKKIMEHHNGSIDIESEEAKGSSFSLMFPPN
ncbi:MAG: two-component sensor histidine kinase, partial [Lentisphaeria bacterium]|nr:two-component sensor histidine kinase [Lentisphaeria bacterium]